MAYVIYTLIGLAAVAGLLVIGALFWKKNGAKASADALALKEAASIVADAVKSKAP